MLRPPCIWYDVNIRKKKKNKQTWFAPKQITSWAHRDIVNVSRHTDVLGGTRHRNDTGEPGLDIALHIVVKCYSLGLEVFLPTSCWNLFAEISKELFEVNAAQRFKQPSCEVRGNRRTEMTRAKETGIVALHVTMWENTQVRKRLKSEGRKKIMQSSTVMEHRKLLLKQYCSQETG